MKLPVMDLLCNLNRQDFKCVLGTPYNIMTYLDGKLPSQRPTENSIRPSRKLRGKKVAEHVGSEKCRRVARQHVGRAAAVRSQMSSLSGVTQSPLIADQYCYFKRSVSAAAAGGEHYNNYYYCYTHAFVCERQRPSVPRRSKRNDGKI